MHAYRYLAVVLLVGCDSNPQQTQEQTQEQTQGSSADDLAAIVVTTESNDLGQAEIMPSIDTALVNDGGSCSADACVFEPAVLDLQASNRAFSVAVNNDSCVTTEVVYSLISLNGEVVVLDQVSDLVQPGRLRHEIEFPQLLLEQSRLDVTAYNSCGCISVGNFSI